MQIRRCAIVFVEPRERVDVDFASLAEGGSGLRREQSWIALAPHLDGEIALSIEQVRALGELSPQAWRERDGAHDSDLLDALIDAGLVVTDAPTDRWRERDDTIRNSFWWPLSAVHHRFSRWAGVDSDRASEMELSDSLRARLGAPEPPAIERSNSAARIALPDVAPTPFDTLLRSRVTCRNFDRAHKLSLSQLSQMLNRVFGALALHRPNSADAMIKRSSPSGGALHPTEAYVLARDIDGLASGLYHYQPIERALEPIAPPDGDADWERWAHRFVSGQSYFAAAPVLVALISRYRRSSWKYRQHAKAYRAAILDAGHLSQTLYLSATELGLGAFITAAVNEQDIEQAFGLDSLRECPLAVCGFGRRAGARKTVEFDPLRAIWPDWG